jgi:hypothetical protein
MRHHSEDVALLIEDAGDVAKGSVWIGLWRHITGGSAVAKGDAVFGFEALEFLRCAEVITFHMANGDLKDVSPGKLAGEGAVGGFDADVDLLANVLEACIAHERAGEQSGFSEDLKTIADTEDKAAALSKAFDGLHDGRKARDGASAEVVAIGKAARNENGIDALQIFRVMPEKADGLVGDFSDDVVGVVVAVGAGKDEDAKFHMTWVPVGGIAEEKESTASSYRRGPCRDDVAARIAG